MKKKDVREEVGVIFDESKITDWSQFYHDVFDDVMFFSDGGGDPDGNAFIALASDVVDLDIALKYGTQAMVSVTTNKHFNEPDFAWCGWACANDLVYFIKNT
jgi:hypothetical protein